MCAFIETEMGNRIFCYGYIRFWMERILDLKHKKKNLILEK